MKMRSLTGLLLVAGALASPTVWSAGPPATRARVFAALPNWTGLWETDAAAELLKSGRFGATALQARPPYNAEWERKAPRTAPQPFIHGDPLPPTTKICSPGGFPTAMGSPVPDVGFEFLITPEQTLVIFADRTVRHIYTDGRLHPTGADLWPTLEGHSIGWWEGQTLVVDTVARIAGPVTHEPGSARLSDKARFTERLHMLNNDTLIDELTIEDPERFSRPWKLELRYQRVKDMDRMIPVDCLENDRNTVVDGHMIIAAP